ncbi:MAG TPA: glycosyltransferase family 2 protein [Actinomycetota bacterium]|nr:glycosyltransferase family 2 protein [Actinomycetota bacterium]
MNSTMMEAEPRVLVVIVTHNGGPWLASALDSLKYQMYRSLDVLVVDSGSESEAAATVARHSADAEVVWSRTNLGFGAAANAGLETSARTADADYFLFLHDDVALDPDAVSTMVETALRTGAGVVGGKGLDWERPQVLVEVGMSADQFLIPYSGLEDGEIDQGQHEALTETLFVSNACMLVSRRLAERCGLWDGAYFAFGEDLDLCLRARLAGFKVFVQPRARYRHALALSNGQRRVARSLPSKGRLARRNQLRTIAKNLSAPRMALALTACVLLGLFRMLALLVLRRVDESSEYPRAFIDFARSFPNVMMRRKAVQKRRTVPDRDIRKLMISDAQRFRVQLERRLRQWERGTLAMGERTMRTLSFSSLRRTFRDWTRQPLTLATGLILLLGLIALRGVLFGEQIAAGTLWPFPDSPGRLMGDYLSGWRHTSLGTESATPPAFPLLWVVSLLGFGHPGLAQKLLLVLLLGLGLLGMNRLVGSSTDRRAARVVAMGVYALNPVTAAIVSNGDLGGLALYALLPFVVRMALRMLGSTDDPDALRPAVDSDSDTLLTACGRTALLLVPVFALAPSALPAVLLMFACLVGGRAVVGSRPRSLGKRARFLLLAVPLAAAVLIPWTFEGLRPSGPILGPAFSGLRGWLYPVWSGYSFSDMFLLNLDTRIGAIVVPAIVVGTLALTGPARRQEARQLAVALLVFGFLGGFMARGLMPPLTASPLMWLTVPLVIVAAMSGHLAAGVSEELPKHAFGWRHKIAIPALGLTLAVGILLGWAPQLAGWDRPEATFAGGTGPAATSTASFMAATAQEVGDFRVLWLGRRWAEPVREGLRRTEGAEYFLTNSSGLTMLDSIPAPPSEGEQRLGSVVNALMGRRLHLAGHLLAPANIQFIVADPDDSSTTMALGRQRDIALEQQQDGVAIYRNLQWLPRANLAPAPLTPEVIADRNPSSLMLVDWIGGRAIPARSPSRFTMELPRTAHSQVLLGDNFNKGWRARVGDDRLEQTQAFGWANSFELPQNASGQIEVYFAQHWVRFLWLVVQVIVLLAVMAMAGTAPPPSRQAR